MMAISECAARHRLLHGSRRQITVTTDLGPATLIDCRLCDRARCPSCKTLTVTGTDERCAKCGASLLIGEPPYDQELGEAA